MADYTSISNASIEPDAPLISGTMFALRDNPTAIAEGAAGAPRIADAALNTSATTAGRDWVLNRAALGQLGAVGTYAMMKIDRSENDVFVPGNAASGSALQYAGINDNGITSAGSITPPGSWRLMGYVSGSGVSINPVVSLWLRIS